MKKGLILFKNVQISIREILLKERIYYPNLKRNKVHFNEVLFMII